MEEQSNAKKIEVITGSMHEKAKQDLKHITSPKFSQVFLQVFSMVKIEFPRPEKLIFYG